LASLTDRRVRRLACVGGTLYVLFLALAPFEHHDIACHLKTPQHCTSCASSVLGPDPASPAPVGAACLTDAGRATADLVLAEDIFLTVRSTGRSPPAAA
jgi:hypothetical protein